MTHGSLFAGIGGFDLGFERAGFETKWQVEIDPFCNKILERHFPQTKRYGDITKLNPALLEKVDVITGGFPCQDLSVAGKRKGLSGERSGLFFELKRIIAGVRPPWFVVENVPGLFSSNRGRDFGLVLFHLEECGYGLAWRILDSRYFGVAQRRRRVFIVGRFGKPCPPEILFESESVRGNSAKVRKTGSDTSRPLKARFGDKLPDHNTFIPVVSATLREHPRGRSKPHKDKHVVVPPLYGSGAGTERTASAGNEAGFCIPTSIRGQHDEEGIDLEFAEEEISPALRDGWQGVTIPIQNPREDGGRHNGKGIAEEEISYTLGTQDVHGVAYQLRANPSKADKPTSTTYVGAATDSDGVRKITGISRRLDTPDGPRYRALGNAVTVNVAEWIAKRIMAWEKDETS